MTIQKLTKFQTSDGQTFDDKEKAKAHENGLHALGELRRLLENTIRTGRPEAVLGQILMEAPMMVAILKGFIRRQPKAEIETKPFVLAKAA